MKKCGQVSCAMLSVVTQVKFTFENLVHVYTTVIEFVVAHTHALKL